MVSNGTRIEIGDKSQPEYNSDEKIWQYMSSGPFQSESEFREYLEALVANTVGAVFCVVDKKAGEQIGITTLMNNFPEHLKIEIGNIWYSPIAQRTFANTESTYLLLSHLFNLGYRRVEWKCDDQNERSKKAALRLGFKYEGTQDCHLIVKGKNRDTAWFRIIDKEWNTVKSELEKKLL